MAKDGALVVWECSMTLTEMQDYIEKTTTTTSTMKDKEEAEGEEGEEEGEMTAGDEKSDGDVESENSDEEEAVAMETVAMVTRLDRRKGDSSGSDGEQDGKCTNCVPATMVTVRLFLSPADLQVPSSKRQKPLNICHWTKTAKSVHPLNMVVVCI